jgi:hypothetical protein
VIALDMQGALRARLLAATPLTALVAQRIYWVERPQSSALPAITLQVVSDPRPQHLKGFQPLRETRVQMDVWGTSSAQNSAITEALIAAAVPEGPNNGIRFNRGIIAGLDTGGETSGTTFIHRTTVDLMVWWSVAEGV